MAYVKIRSEKTQSLTGLTLVFLGFFAFFWVKFINFRYLGVYVNFFNKRMCFETVVIESFTVGVLNFLSV